MKNNVFLKILCRFLKEKGIYSEFYNTIDFKLLKVTNLHYLTFSDNSLYYIISTYSKNTTENVIKFSINPENNKQFNRTILKICFSYIIDFINKNNLNEKIFANIKYQSDKSIHEYDYINDYLTGAYYRGISPFNLFIHMFKWNLSNEDYNFWADIDYDFRKYLINFLTSGDVNENYSQTSV